MKNEKIDITGIIIITFLFILLTVAAYISYKNIDWKVLEKLENQELILPTPIPPQSTLPITPTL